MHERSAGHAQLGQRWRVHESQVTFQLCLGQSDTGLSARQERARQLGMAEVPSAAVATSIRVEVFICNF